MMDNFETVTVSRESYQRLLDIESRLMMVETVQELEEEVRRNHVGVSNAYDTYRVLLKLGA